MLTPVHLEQIIANQLDKINEQQHIISSCYNVLNDLAEQESILDNHLETLPHAIKHIEEMASLAAKERMELNKYLRLQLYSN